MVLMMSLIEDMSVIVPISPSTRMVEMTLSGSLFRLAPNCCSSYGTMLLAAPICIMMMADILAQERVYKVLWLMSACAALSFK